MRIWVCVGQSAASLWLLTGTNACVYGVGASTAIGPLIELLKLSVDKAGVDVPTASAAQKNAAIALARLAKHAPHLERIRELRGMEILMALNHSAKWAAI